MKNLNERKRFWQSQNPNYIPSKKEANVIENDKPEIKRKNNFSPSSYYSKSQNQTSNLFSDSQGQNRTSSFSFNNRVQNRTSWFGPNTKTKNRRSSLGSSQQKLNSTKDVKGKGKLDSKQKSIIIKMKLTLRIQEGLQLSQHHITHCNLNKTKIK